jgi:hypothetical protein
VDDAEGHALLVELQGEEAVGSPWVPGGPGNEAVQPEKLLDVEPARC